MFLFGRRKSKASVRKSPPRVRLCLEALEDRLVPTATTLTVAAGDTAALIADINSANTSGTPTTINLTQSTYDFTSANNNTFGPNALPVITGNITINGNGAVLMRDPSLGQNTPFRLFYVSGDQVASATGSQSTSQPVGSLTLENVTLEGGLAQGGSSGTGGGGLGAGGAIFNQGNLTLNGVTVEQSAAVGGSSGSGSSTSGGDVATTTSSASPLGTFGSGGSGSTSSSGGAGGFGGGGGSGTPAGASGFGAGAGASTVGGGGLGAGGAIFNMYGTTTLINTTLASNIAQGGNGASGYGGAIFNLDGTLNVTSSTIAVNEATAGGAIYNLSYGSTTNNAGTAQGVASTVTLTNSILADSIASNDLVNDENSSTAGAAVVNATTPNIVMASSTIDSATTNGTPLTSNPELGLLTNNGGSTPTMALMTGSPALGAGAASANEPTTDQRGATRGTVLDLGAYQGTPPGATAATTTATSMTLTSTSTTTSTGQSVTLTATITPASGGATPAGTVQFVDTTSGTTLGSATVTVVNGQAQATLTPTTLTPGGDTITATYTSSNGLGSSTATTTASAGSQTQQWLNQVYEALLGRPIDPTGLAYWSGILAGGATPTAVVYDIEQTSAYQDREINNAFEKLLGVAAPTSALNYLQSLMSQGTSFRTIEAIIGGSSEFYQAAGGTNSTWLNAIYQDFLNVPAIDSATATASESSWLALLNAGYTPTQVLIDIMGTQQYLTDLVEQDYMTYFGQLADPTSLAAFVSALQGNTTSNAMIVASLLGSGTYQTLTGT